MTMHAYKLGLPACGAAYCSDALATDTDAVTCPKCVDWVAQLTEAHMVRHGAYGVRSTQQTWCDAYSWPSDAQPPWPLANTPEQMTCVACIAVFDAFTQDPVGSIRRERERLPWLK